MGGETLDLVCRLCGRPFPDDEGDRTTTVAGCGADSRLITYSDLPYNWDPALALCLTCHLIGEPVPRADVKKFGLN